MYCSLIFLLSNYLFGKLTPFLFRFKFRNAFKFTSEIRINVQYFFLIGSKRGRDRRVINFSQRLKK